MADKSCSVYDGLRFSAEAPILVHAQSQPLFFQIADNRFHLFPFFCKAVVQAGPVQVFFTSDKADDPVSGPHQLRHDMRAQISAGSGKQHSMSKTGMGLRPD